MGSSVLTGGRRLIWALPLAIVWVTACTSLLWWANVPRVIGWWPVVVMSDSMRPAFQAGDVVVIAPVDDPSALPKGRILLVRDASQPGGTLLHRLVSDPSSGSIITRGDANRSEDRPAVHPAAVLGQARLVVPKLGIPVEQARRGSYGPLVGVLVLTWAAVTVLLSVTRVRRRRIRADQPATRPRSSSA